MLVSAELLLPDAALDESVPVKEPTKDDKVVSESEDDEPESPKPEVRLERESDSDRLFCCEVVKTVDV